MINLHKGTLNHNPRRHAVSIRTLKTARLTIRPFVKQDFKHRVALFNAEEDKGIFGTEPPGNPLEQARIARGLENLNDLGFEYHWTLMSRGEAMPIGFIDAYLPGPHLMSFKGCEISYGLAREYRQQGYMTEAMDACLSFLIRAEGFRRFEANINPNNRNSLQFIARMGFKQEGVRKKMWLWDGEWHDMSLYALLADDYEGLIHQNRASGTELGILQKG
jgi:[ribosomal protein S5]-alanine N-acetyltransferase